MVTPTRITYMSKLFLALSVAAIATAPMVPAAAHAQVVVGHTPEKSPYHDIDAVQRFTFFGGYFQTQGDGLNTTPQSGPAFGVRYDLPVAGPADFFVRVERVNSKRESFDPTLPADTRALGTENIAMYVADLGFGLNLTGRRTWHGIIPTVDFGLGIANAAASSSDDPYDFGTQFAFTVGLGLRYNPSNSYEIRLDATPTFYQNHYPAAYFTAPSGTTPLLSNTDARSGYQHSISYTAGLSIPIFR